MRVAIVTAMTDHPGQGELTTRFVKEHLECAGKDDTIVIAGTDSALAPIRQFPNTYFPRVQLAHMNENISFSQAMNKAIMRAVRHNPEYILLVGNDGFPTEKGWIDKLIAAQKETGAAIVCPTPSRPNISVYEGTKIGEIKGYPQYRMFPAICWLMPVETVRKTGLFDERFIGGCYEDNDYVHRVQLWGGTMIVHPEVMLEHLLSQTIGNYDVSALMDVNRARFFAKWGLR